MEQAANAQFEGDRLMFGGYTGLSDMIDGGGAGRSGNTFEGGPMSGLLNSIGVRPMGYAARQQDAMSTRPRQRPAVPMQGGGMQQPMPPAVSVMPPQSYAPTADYMGMLMRAVKSAPAASSGLSREQLVNMMRGYY